VPNQKSSLPAHGPRHVEFFHGPQIWRNSETSSLLAVTPQHLCNSPNVLTNFFGGKRLASRAKQRLIKAHENSWKIFQPRRTLQIFTSKHGSVASRPERSSLAQTLWISLPTHASLHGIWLQRHLIWHAPNSGFWTWPWGSPSAGRFASAYACAIMARNCEPWWPAFVLASSGHWWSWNQEPLKENEKSSSLSNNWSMETMKSMQYVGLKSSMHSGEEKLSKSWPASHLLPVTWWPWTAWHRFCNAKWTCLESVNWRKQPDLQQIKEHPKIHMTQHKNEIYAYIYIIMW